MRNPHGFLFRTLIISWESFCQLEPLEALSQWSQTSWEILAVVIVDSHTFTPLNIPPHTEDMRDSDVYIKKQGVG